MASSRRLRASKLMSSTRTDALPVALMRRPVVLQFSLACGSATPWMCIGRGSTEVNDMVNAVVWPILALYRLAYVTSYDLASGYYQLNLKLANRLKRGFEEA